MAPSSFSKIAAVLPGKPGFSRMSAAEFNAHLLANPGGLKRGGEGCRSGAGKPGGVRPRRASHEEDLQRQVFGWIFAMQTAYPVLLYMLHVPNGGARSKGEAGKLKAMGVRKGVSDVICPFTGFAGSAFKGFACELKAPKGKCSPEQTDFLDKAKADGWLTATCFSLDEFIAMAKTFLGIPGGVFSPAARTKPAKPAKPAKPNALPDALSLSAPPNLVPTCSDRCAKQG